jgi:hypothetical protein
LIFLISSIYFIGFSVIAKAQNTAVTPKKMWTISEIKEMAKKYNLQDSVVLPRNAFLVYLNRKTLDFYLKRQSAQARENQEWFEYSAKNQYVRTFDEDAKLVELYPTIRASIVKSRGGEKAHQEYIAAARQYQWRIYRNSDGGLAFFRADQPIEEREFQYGKRIDNLQKQ